MAEIKKVEKSSIAHKTKNIEREHDAKRSKDLATRLMGQPASLSAEDILQAQREVGNQTVQRALDPSMGKDKETEGTLSKSVSDRIQSKRGGGSALPENVRKPIAKQLGHELSGVRVHTDSEADKLSRSMGARAFTVGSDIFFKNGVYSPESEKGRETIIHELTHVVQQSSKKVSGGRLKLGAADTGMEKEADRTGKKLAARAFGARSSNPANASVQRQAEEEEPLQAQRDPMIQRQVEDEELLQGQSDPLIQRQAEEEEEVQPQREPMIQRQGEEEEEPLQAQRDPLIHRQAEEEEEIQTQPDPVVQRDLLEEIKAEKLRRLQLGGRKKRIEQTEKLEEKHRKIALDPKVISTAKVQQKQAQQKAKALGDRGKEMGIGGKKNLANLKKLDDTRAKKDKKAREDLYKQEKEDKKTKSRNQLMSTIRDKNASSEDVKAAQEKLDTLHKRGKWDTFKSVFTPGKSSKSYSEQAMQSRKISLKGAAEAGDEKAFEKYKSEKAERKANSKTTKVLGFMGKAGLGIGKGIAGLVGGQLSKQLGSYKEHFFGKSEEKKEDEGKSEAKEPAQGNAGAGFGGIMEKYGDLVRENESLKRKLAEAGGSEEKV